MVDEIIKNRHISVRIRPEELCAQIQLVEKGLSWRFEPNLDGDVWVRHGQTEATAYLREAPRKTVRRIRRPGEERVTVLLEGLPGGTALSITFALPEDEPELRVEVEPLPTGSSSRVVKVQFPGMLSFEDSEPRYTVWPNAAGMLLPNDYPKAVAPEGEKLEKRMGFNRALCQPWWGIVADRGAYLAIAETPFDFAFDVRHPAGGPTRTRPVWMPSMGHLSYPRAIRYRLYEQADYVRLAKDYRAYAQSIGRWMSLKEKFERNPLVRRLVGSVIFPVTICTHSCQQRPPSHKVVTFEERIKQVHRLKSLGQDRVYLHIDGWGYRGYDNQHPDIFPPCPEAGGWKGLIELSETARECGYLFGLHDQYRDYYLGGPQFVEGRTIKDRDQNPPQWVRWDGGMQSLLCAKEALANIRRNFTELLGRGVALSASYLDVFAIEPMDECYDPAHPMTREDCFRWRATGLDYVRSLGLAISSEEPMDCFIPHLDFAHWADYPREGFMEGACLGIPVPLHSLVYHDALLLPAVFDYGGTAKNRPRHFLQGLSQVEIPYGKIEWAHKEDFRYVNLLRDLHAAWGIAELVGHRLLDEEGWMQEFEYPEGTVSIDLKDLRYRIEGGPVATDGWVSVSL